MRCKSCDYRLWNLRSRQCPECGNAFRPSEFEFVPQSVEFRCPHCDQSYYGAGPNGHLDPAEFECASCNRRIHMDEMILLPTAGVEEEQTRVEDMPWLERKRRGFFRAWVQTIGRAMTTPGRLMRGLPATSPNRAAWGFCLSSNLLFALTGLTPVLVFPFIIGFMAARAPGGGGPGVAAPPILAFAIGGVGFLVAGVVISLLLILIWGAIPHGLLRATGQVAYPIGQTYQALCYSSGANALTAIPCFGSYVGWIWWLVSAVLMVKERQGVGGKRAALCVLAAPVASVVCLVGSYIVLIIFMVTSAGSMAGTTSGSGGIITMPPPGPGGITVPSPSQRSDETDLEVVLGAIAGYTATHGGRAPDHAIELVTGGYINPETLVSVFSLTTMDGVQVGGTTLGAIADDDGGAKDAINRIAIHALPEDVIAHRVGDFVFTYHGIDPADAEDALWFVISSWDPDANDPPGPDQMIIATYRPGGVVSFRGEDVEKFLAAQNELRAQYDLAALPDPYAVTHDKPAVSAD